MAKSDQKTEKVGDVKAVKSKQDTPTTTQDPGLGKLGPSVAKHENAPTTLDKGVKQGKKEDDEYGVMSVITGKYVITPGKPKLDPEDMLKTQAAMQAKEAKDDKTRAAAKVSKSKPQKKY